MPERRSTVDELPEELRSAIELAIIQKRATVDELVALVDAHGRTVSRSAMGRHRKATAERLAKYRDTQDIAREWMAQFKASPDGDVGQLLAELLKLLAFRTQMEMQEEGTTLDPLQLARLSQMIRNLAASDVVKAKLREEADKAARARAADTAATVAREAGLSAAAVAKIRRDVLGVRSVPAKAPS